MRKKHGGHVLFWILNISLPLLAGLAAYLIFRPDAAISRAFYDFTKMAPPELSTGWSRLDLAIRYFAPDILWAYGLSAVAMLIMGPAKIGVFAGAVLSTAFEVALELLQLYGVVPGTFDIRDVLLEIAASAVSMIVVLMVLGSRKNAPGEGVETEQVSVSEGEAAAAAGTNDGADGDAGAGVTS